MKNDSFNVLEEIQKITMDNKHGSLYVTKQAIDIIINFLDHISADIETIIPIIEKTSFLLFKSQSSMALLYNFINDLIYQLDEIKDEENDKIKNELKSWCSYYKNTIEKETDAISSNLYSIISDDSVIGTYSSSETVYKAILFLHENNKKIKIICSESRPILEGTTLSIKLVDHNVPTTLTTDAYLFSRISNCDIIIVGVDALLINGVINKIGTFPLATIANKENIPIYALCSTKKILPRQISPPDEPLKKSSEIFNGPPQGLIIENRYFDSTPLHLFTGIITEQGIENPSFIKRNIVTKKIHPSLQKYIKNTSADKKI